MQHRYCRLKFVISYTKQVNTLATKANKQNLIYIAHFIRGGPWAMKVAAIRTDAWQMLDLKPMRIQNKTV